MKIQPRTASEAGDGALSRTGAPRLVAATLNRFCHMRPLSPRGFRSIGKRSLDLRLFGTFGTHIYYH